MGEIKYLMSEKEITRYVVISNYIEGDVTRSEAAESLGLSERQITRMKKGVIDEGVAFLKHKNSGRKPSHAIDDKTAKKYLISEVLKKMGMYFTSASVSGFTEFLRGTTYVCGHNIFRHDLKYVKNAICDAGIDNSNIIDTLFFSPLLFPAKPYHALLKDDKLHTEDINNPLNDSIKAKDLFYDEVMAFKQLDSILKRIYYCLLKNIKEFEAFFRFLDFEEDTINIETAIRERFKCQICEQANLTVIISEHINFMFKLLSVNLQAVPLVPEPLSG